MSDGSAAHIDNANKYADLILVSLSSILVPFSSDELTVISESVSSFRDTLEHQIKTTLLRINDSELTYKKGVELERKEALIFQEKLTAANNANATALAEIEKALTALKQQFSQVVSTWQTEFQTAQDKRAAEFTTAQTERQTKITDMLANFQTLFTNDQTERQKKFTDSMAENKTQFSTVQDERATSFANFQRENQTQFASLVADYTKKLEEQNKQFNDQQVEAKTLSLSALDKLKVDYEESGKRILEEINNHKSQVEKLVGVIGNLGVTSGYQKVADRAKKTMYFWQGTTIVALGGLIYFAYGMIPAQTPSPISDAGGTALLRELAARLFLSITFGVFAAYSSKQAARNFEMERRNRKLALELEALGPFIAPLPLEMQNKFRNDVGERSFGIPDGIENVRHSEKDPVTVIDLLKHKDFKGLFEAIKEFFAKS